ncbi:unnamed protein product [Echinostoma caproni]|uniref:dual-specificity kinase n=1 Tax=Echinostoma caproni TaxID=27848 RepID=A0A183AVI6_9TREM|nr:unnamed protein product [Echinostoma caproni]
MAPINFNSHSTDQLESLMKRHRKHLPDAIPSKGLSNAALSFVHAQKMRSNRHQPRDSLARYSDVTFDSIKPHQVWLPRVALDNETTRSQQNVLESSWSSITGNQRRINRAGRRRANDYWKSELAGMQSNVDQQNSRPIKDSHLVNASAETMSERTTTSFPKVRNKAATTNNSVKTAGSSGELWSGDDRFKHPTDHTRKKQDKEQTVLSLLDSIAENKKISSQLSSSWTKLANIGLNAELRLRKQSVDNPMNCEKHAETSNSNKTLTPRLAPRHPKIPTSIVISKRSTPPTVTKTNGDVALVSSKEPTDSKHATPPLSHESQNQAVETVTVNSINTPRLEFNGTKTSITKKSDDVNLTTKSSWPMQPNTALSLYGKKLTAYERQELNEFPEIWFLGLDAEKIHGVPGAPLNAGYDDEHGTYLKVTSDHLAYRYEVLETLGKGSFGRVVRAIDHQTGNTFAIKIIRNKKRFHQQAQVEVTVLEELKRADPNNLGHIIHIRDHFVFRNHLCIVFDLMGYV